MIDFEYAKHIAELMVDEKITEDLFFIRFEALRKLRSMVSLYEKEGFLPELVETIFCKKAEMIGYATSKSTLEEILKPSTPIYYGGKFSPQGEFYVEEEELLLWSRTSLIGPLIPEGQKRFEELFKKYVQEESTDSGLAA